MVGTAQVIEESPGAAPSRQAGTLPTREMADIVTDDSSSSGGAGNGQPSAEEAIAAAKRSADEANARAAAADGRARQAEARARSVETTARQSSTAEKISAVKSRIESAQGDIDSAKAQKRAARDAGNYEDEDAAEDRRAQAYAKLEADKRELQWLEGQAKTPSRQQGGDGPTSRAQDQGGDGYDAAAPDVPQGERQWVESHPLFNSDARYHAAAVAAAQEAMSLGMMRGSPAYINHINDVLTPRFGAGHGVDGTHGRKGGAAARDGGEGGDRLGRRPLSMAMPRSGADGGNSDMETIGSGNARTMDTEFGKVTVEAGRDGKPVIRMPSRLKAMWEDAASWMRHVDNTPYTLAEYALEQVQADEERRQGLDNGLQYEGDKIYR